MERIEDNKMDNSRREYIIKTLLVKDRGVTPDTKGIFNYSQNKLLKFESTLEDTPLNRKRFEKFKKAVLEKEELDVYASLSLKHAGVILENGMVLNFTTDRLLEIGEILKTPKGKIAYVQLSSSNQRRIFSKSVDEDLDIMTDNIYELSADKFTTSLFYVDGYTFTCDGQLVRPVATVKVPEVTIKTKYAEHFRLTPVRDKLVKKLKGQVDTTLRSILLMDANLPEDFKMDRLDWEPERRVFDYVCQYPEFIYAYGTRSC